MRKKHPATALEYASKVVRGDVVCGKYNQLACQRFLSDLKRQDIYFDESAAQSACAFVETLPHTKGKWAAKRETLKLEPWQAFILCNVFGWMRKDGTRRFRVAYNEIARKNGKSALAAGIGLYCFCADNEFGAEVYSGATTEKQAWEVFRPAKQIVERTAALRQHYDVDVNAKNMVILSNGSRFEPLIGKPGDGASPSCAIVDEYHEHDSDELYQTMETGMGAREQPLMCVITTAGANIGGPCYELRSDVIRVLEGTVEDDSIFAIIFTCDEGDEWDSEEALLKANPNIDVSVSGDFLRQQLAQARRSSSKQNHYRTKHLNQWVGTRAAWMNMLAWQRQKKSMALEDFAGMDCFVAVDLSSKKDLTSICILFKKDGHYYAFEKFYAPEAAIQDNDKYRQFVIAGELTETPGNTTDYAFIEEELKELARRFRVEYFIFDQWQANYLITRMQEQRLPVMELPMTTKNLSDAMKEVEARVLEGQLWHDGNTCMTWQIGNVTAKADARNNIYPRKENENDQRCHIDGPVTLIMAMNRWQLDQDSGLSDFLSNPVSV